MAHVETRGERWACLLNRGVKGFVGTRFLATEQQCRARGIMRPDKGTVLEAGAKGRHALDVHNDSKQDAIVKMSNDEAMAVGLVNRVYDDQETMMTEVMAIARDIASKPPLAIHGCKRMANYARDHPRADGLDYTSIWNASILQHEHIMEAMQSNAEKRRGQFAELPPGRRVLDQD